jgi:hypothetical protein
MSTGIFGTAHAKHGQVCARAKGSLGIVALLYLCLFFMFILEVLPVAWRRFSPKVPVQHTA